MRRYIPPGRRREGAPAAQSAAETEQRALEGAAGGQAPQVRLVALHPQGLDTSGCPCDIEAQEGQPGSWLIYYPERSPRDLLAWFAATLGGAQGRLEFPPSLSKRERAWWHGMADHSRLHTQSVGVGDGRYLTISTAAPAAGDAAPQPGPGAGSLHLSREQHERARQIYDCCQMEGGKYWERSHGEIEAMVASGEPLPADLQELVDKRLRGQQVHALLRGGDPTAALELLSEDAKLAWVKDQQSGGYPIHVAAWKGYESVVTFLASLPGVLEQRDGRRDTALATARRRGNSSMEQLLLEAGAKPEHASFQEAAPGGASPSGAAADDGEYMSWSREERAQYRHGGEGGRGRGGPPGLQSRGGRGRAGRGAPSGSSGAE